MFYRSIWVASSAVKSKYLTLKRIQISTMISWFPWFFSTRNNYIFYLIYQEILINGSEIYLSHNHITIFFEGNVHREKDADLSRLLDADFGRPVANHVPNHRKASKRGQLPPWPPPTRDVPPRRNRLSASWEKETRKYDAKGGKNQIKLQEIKRNNNNCLAIIPTLHRYATLPRHLPK